MWVIVGVDDDWQVAASTSKAHHTQKTKESEQRATWLSTESEYPRAYAYLKLDRAWMDHWLRPFPVSEHTCYYVLASWPLGLTQILQGCGLHLIAVLFLLSDAVWVSPVVESTGCKGDHLAQGMKPHYDHPLSWVGHGHKTIFLLTMSLHLETHITSHSWFSLVTSCRLASM